MSEKILGALLCGLLGGSEVEAPVWFENQGRQRHIRVDCLTEDFAFEFGLDSMSSRDSVHQAVLASELTNTEPVVVIIDRDGVEGKIEQEMRIVSEALGVRYARCNAGFIQRRSATARFRAIGLDKSLDDLPRTVSWAELCPLAQVLEE